jgi:hypothetical protein
MAPQREDEPARTRSRRSRHTRTAAQLRRRPRRVTGRDPAAEAVTVVQRAASNTGVIMAAGQKIALGRIHAARRDDTQSC